jgi:hypothetical protein
VKSLCLTTLLCFLVLASPDAVFPEGRLGKLPLRVASALGPDSDPAWIDAESVVDRDGKLAMSALPIGIRLFAERQIQNGDYQKYGCISFGAVAIDRAGPIVPHSTFKDLTQSAKAALKGTVTSITYGFTVYGPSSLVEIQVDDWLKKSAKIASGSYVYLVYPVAEFKVGGYRFCKTDLPQWGREPKPGDQILLFPYQSPIDADGLVFLPDPNGYEVILARKDNTSISLPKALREDPDALGVRDLEILRKRALEYIQKSVHGD